VHAKRRQAMGKSAIVVDHSMMNVREQGDVGDDDRDAPTGDRAFDDETDFKNEDFIYIY
jgi:hypothetical protein